MDVTSLLNSASGAAAMEGKLQLIHERKDSSDEELADSLQTPSATTAGSTAPSSVAATPLEKTPSRRSSDSRTPNRNRTPWDAGGYSLSLALDSTKTTVQSSPGAGNVYVVTGMSVQRESVPLSTASPETMDLIGSCGSPKSASPRHKFSDSRSSFSSAYTNASSTNNSVSHSRISSLSTVSENQPLATLITDFSLLETRISDPCIAHLHHANQHQLKLHQYSFAAEMSPDKQGFQPESPTPVRSRHNLSVDASPEPSPRSPGRAQSPSDAMLIPRAGQMATSSQSDAEFPPSTARLQIPSTHLRSQSRSDLLQPGSSPTRCHKRAVSAPDFPSIGSSTFNPRFPTFGPIPEPTPSPSQHSDGNTMEHDSGSSSPTAGEQPAAGSGNPSSTSNSAANLTPSSSVSGPLTSSPRAASPPTSVSARHPTHQSANSISDHPTSTEATTETPVNFETASVCMYRGDCQTGSQLRKAISHIFGRNKLCTRMIPTGVWVHYCRKHYQRTRYRNGGEYPQRQIGLVQEQVRRVQAWSDSNSQQSRGPILKDWSLSVRKREQLRLDSKMASTGKKRPFHDDGLEDDEEVFDDDRADMSGTAVPDWVVAQIGDGYSTTDILSIVDRLKLDIDQGRLQQIPDIEILPNIVTDSTNDEPATGNNGAKKTYAKRRTVGPSVGGGHRRSQSVNTSAMRSDAIPMARRSSQPNNFLAPSAGLSQPRLHPVDHLQLPLEKRQRVDSEGIDYQHHANGIPERFEQPPAVGSNALPRPGYGSRLQLAHRPAFAGIRESQAEGQTYYYPSEQRYGTDANGFHSHQHPMAESTSGGYAGERRYSGGVGSSALHGFETRREHERHHSTSSSMPGHSAYGLLPAPNPQRFGGPSVAQQLETSSYVLNSAATRRTGGLHQRSQSEAGCFHHLSSSHYGRPTSSNGHAPLPFSGLPRLSANASSSGFSQEESRTSGFSSYNSHDHGHGSQGAGAGGHHSHQNYSTNHHHHSSHNGHLDDERCGNPNSQSTFGYAGGNGNPPYDKFENVQLPPLQSIQSMQRAPALGSGASVVDGHLSAVSDYPGTSRHSRHQSSPAVTRMLPAAMEVGGASSLPVPGQPVSSTFQDT